ncbi:MAG: transposase DNA-binding-containing protein, partial [Thermosynechococcaceae cyanobacterium]
MVETLSAQPTASIPHASDDWGQTKATYQFWANSTVSAAGILEAHRVSVQERLQ